MKAEYSSRSIEKWYKRVVNLNRHWRERKREKERLRGRKEIET